jgi:hypothetical protein
MEQATADGHRHIQMQTCAPPVTMAGRPEGAVKLELAAGVVVRMSWVMR